MKILITGANGQLGNEMQLLGATSNNCYIYTDVAELDITDASAVKEMVTEQKIDIIVNCAAYTNVDKAEDDAEFAQLLNATAVRNLASALKEVDGTLIHVSTDYVFGGGNSNTPYSESAPESPIGVYGRTKLNGEKAITEVGCSYLIIRTAWLYSEFGNNFVKTMLRLTSEKDELKVVFDQVGTPTYAKDLARAIFEIIENKKHVGNSGIYHYSNEGVCSWFDFTKEIARITGATKCNIQPCYSRDFPSKVTRPSYSVLDKAKIKRVFAIEVPYWTDSLAECIKNIKK